jgi:hypothetical protein
MYTCKLFGRRAFSLESIFTDNRTSILSLPLLRHCHSIVQHTHTTECHHCHHFLRHSPHLLWLCTIPPPFTLHLKARRPVHPHRHHPTLLRPLPLLRAPFQLHRLPSLQCSHIAIPGLLLQLTSLSLVPALLVHLSRDSRAFRMCFQSVKAGVGSRAPCGLST